MGVDGCVIYNGTTTATDYCPINGTDNSSCIGLKPDAITQDNFIDQRKFAFGTSCTGKKWLAGLRQKEPNGCSDLTAYKQPQSPFEQNPDWSWNETAKA